MNKLVCFASLYLCEHAQDDKICFIFEAKFVFEFPFELKIRGAFGTKICKYVLLVYLHVYVY